MNTSKALVSSSDPRDQRELWNKRMGHIHQEALKLLQEIMASIPEVSMEHNDGCKGFVMGKFAMPSF